MTQPEHSQEPQHKEMIDLAGRLRLPDFYTQVQFVENELHQQEVVGSVKKKFINKRVKRLNKLIGTEYKYMPAQLLALAQIIDGSDEPTGEEEILQPDRDLNFMGVDSFVYQEQRRLALRFRDINNIEQDYMVLFADLVDLSVADPIEAYGLREVIADQAIAARERVCHPDFFVAGYHTQQETFHAISAETKLTIDRLCGEDGRIDISCTEYYKVGDSDNSIVAHRVDQSQLPFEEQKTLTGRVIDVLYVEPALDYFHIFTDASDYIVGDGAPCLVMRQSKKECMYFIPLMAVTGAEVDEASF